MKFAILFLTGLFLSIGASASMLEKRCPGIPDTVIATFQCSPKDFVADAIIVQASERIGCAATERFSLRYQNSSPIMKADLGVFDGDGSIFLRAYKGVEEYVFLQGTNLGETRFSSVDPVSAKWYCRK
jgi:hypothetical protein